MTYFVFLILFNTLAFGQAEFDISDRPDQYEGVFKRGDRQWPNLKAEMTTTLKPGTSVYNLPEMAVNPSQNLSIMPWNYWKERCERGVSAPTLQGRLLFQSGDISAIRLDQPENFCGSYFNDGQEDRTVVFVKTGDIDQIVPAGEEVTEAVAVSPKCTNCDDPHSLSALKEMAKVAASGPKIKNCQKTDAEMEKYLRCHATKDQANYNRYYRKLFNIAGSTFQAAYTPGEKGGGVRAILRPDDAQTGKTVPFLVRAKANVMKCVGLRESMWDPTKVSGCPAGKTCLGPNGKPLRGGAMGLGQQTNTNVEHIKCLLEGCVRKGEVVKPSPWAQQLWKEFFRRVRAELTMSEQAELYTHPVTGARCTETMSVKERDAPCPINSIAAMALYQVEAELMIRRTSPMYKDSATADFNVTERCDLDIVQGSTNNAGTGTVRGAVGKAAPSEWRGRLRESTGDPDDHGKETDQFSKYIRNCLQAGNMDSMHPPIPGKKASDCSEYSR